MKKSFSEEQKRLVAIIQAINNKIVYLEATMPYPTVGRYSVGYDIDDRINLSWQKAQNDENYEVIAYFAEFKDSPYFSRMDFEVKKNHRSDYITMYIGKKSLVLDGNHLVYDWRSPIGQRYYLKNELEFLHNDYHYYVMLRRALEIKKATLLKCNDEYVFGAEIFDGGVADPFLVQTLREKKGERKLTDIIKTIQQNQNQIIRHPLQNNIIVQGCAGSGKTMIMLHRLSYLKFNNPNLDLDTIKILTPNELFNIHINDLTENLELEKIQRLTVEEYYLNLLSRYDPNRWKEIKKILPESSLNRDFLKKVYSEEFYREGIDIYRGFVNQVASEIHLEELQLICSRYGYAPYLESSSSDENLIGSYKYFITQIKKENERYIKQRDEKLRVIKSRENKKVEQEKQLTTNPQYVYTLGEYMHFQEMFAKQKNKQELLEDYRLQLQKMNDKNLTYFIRLNQTLINSIESQLGNNLLPLIENILKEGDLLLDLEKSLLEQKQRLVNEKEPILKDLANLLSRKLTTKIKYLSSDLVNLETDSADLTHQRQVPQAKIDQINSKIVELKRDYSKLNLLSTKLTLNNYKKEMIEEVLPYIDSIDDVAPYIKELTDLERDLKATSFLNIMKTRKLKTGISQLFSKMWLQLHESLDIRKHSIQQAIQNEENSIAEVSKEINVLDQKIAQNRDTILKITSDINLYSFYCQSVNNKEFDESHLYSMREVDANDSEVDLLFNRLEQTQLNLAKCEQEHADILDTQKGFLSTQSKLLENTLTELMGGIAQENEEIELRLRALEVEMALQSKHIEKLTHELELLKSELELTNHNLISSEELSQVDLANSYIQKITVEQIYQRTIGQVLSKAIEEFKISYNKEEMQRFILYSYLLFYYLYRNKLNTHDSYLNIDEGQDISVCEYKLINQVNGGNVVFNIYGDVNQLIKSGQGICNWNQISDLIPATTFKLNENYRNTRQVTDYCNDKLSFDSISIGVTGPEVSYLSQVEAIRQLKEIAKKKSQKRIAVLIKDLSVSSNVLRIEGLGYQTIKPSTVSVLSVERAKGLEFDTVYVIPDGMSRNEKYIAFTRSLNDLFIISDVNIEDKTLSIT